MKVLYFIPKIKDRYLPALCKMLAGNMDGVDEIHAVTPRTEEGLHIDGIKIHYLSAYPVMIARNRSRFRKIVDKVNPDIIHIFGAWDITASFIEKWGEDYRIPVVFSPLKGFAPWNVRHHYWSRRLPALLLFQRRMIKRAHAIHVTSRQEMKFAMEMNWHPSFTDRETWNSRIAIIPNPMLTDETDTDKTARSMLRLYNKVLDSNPFLRMTEADRMNENTLLRAGLSQGNMLHDITKKARERLFAMDDKAWRRILLHSTDEGIADIIISGAIAMQLKKKSIVIENTERFENKQKDTGAANSSSALMKNGRMSRIKEKFKGYGTEAELCTMMINIVYGLRNGTLCRRHIADMYTHIRFKYYNESVLRLMLKQVRMYKTAARLMQIMSETIGLENGFMPLEPLDDKRTDNIRKTLFKYKIQ